jgi:fructan beta-fructosidase
LNFFLLFYSIFTNLHPPPPQLPDGTWRLAVSLSEEHKVRFYASGDLKSWTMLSEFGPAAATGGVWECPDLFELPGPPAASSKLWVLIVNLNPGGPVRGSGTQYFVGDWDGTTFTPQAEPGAAAPRARWLDHGPDLYATVTFGSMPRDDPRRIAIGWMSNWEYANELPTRVWRGTMSIPRALSLFTAADGTVAIASEPVAELGYLEQSLALNQSSVVLQAGSGDAVAVAPAPLFDVTIEVGPQSDGDWRLEVFPGAATGTVTLDFSGTGDSFAMSRPAVPGVPGFACDNVAVQLVDGAGPARTVRVLLDRSSVEIFVNGGTTAFTSRVFPSDPIPGRALAVRGIRGTTTLARITAQPVKPTVDADTFCKLG